MRISSIKYYISEAFKSLRRNKTISTASISTVAVTLFIFGIFLVLIKTLEVNVADVGSKIKVIVYLKKDVTEEQTSIIKSELESINGVKDVEYKSKEVAFAEFSERLKQNPELLKGYTVENNPTSSSLMVVLEDWVVESKDLNVSAEIENGVKDLPGVDQVRKDDELIQKVSSFSSGLRIVGLVLFILLIGASLFLIGNTIKITVFSRRREIGIMKYVGATDWFIKWPFIVEGLFIGVLGALISNLLLFLSYNWIYGKFVANQGLMIISLIQPTYIYTYILGVFVVSGALIGILGSTISIRRFLVV